MRKPLKIWNDYVESQRQKHGTLKHLACATDFKVYGEREIQKSFAEIADIIEAEY